MRWLNYHHLYYFWVVAKRGSITAACRELRLAQPTVSAQIRSLEESLGEQLLVRGGRGLTLTEAGHMALRYADEIFALGNEFINRMEGKASGMAPALTVGVSDSIPKSISYRILGPAFTLEGRPKIVVYEDQPDKLLAELAVRHLDLVISDAPIPTAIKVKAYDHYLGHCGVVFLAIERFAKKYGPGFPKSLNGAPMLFPSQSAALRRDIDKWFADRSIEPVIIGEIQDGSLMKLMAARGHGIIPVAEAVRANVEREYGLSVVGRTTEIKEHYYLISVERKIKHPGVKAICEHATARVFGSA